MDEKKRAKFQEGASQAGILLGSNEDIPAFRWVEKETQTMMTCSAPADCAEIERRRGTGIGLLVDGGASRGNLLSGEADEESETIGRVVVEEGARIVRSRVVGPVVIGAGTEIVDSYVGPFTSIAENCQVTDSELEFSIVLRDSSIRGVGRIESSLIGRHVGRIGVVIDVIDHDGGALTGLVPEAVVFSPGGHGPTAAPAVSQLDEIATPGAVTSGLITLGLVRSGPRELKPARDRPARSSRRRRGRRRRAC